jgi:uncharacterized protein
MTALGIPLFPLQTVLFPGGALPLKIFEQRYMDMAKACLKDEAPFGICLIRKGGEVGAPASPHPVGTLARIARWDMPQLGVLQVLVHGGERFRILQHWAEPSGLLRAEVQLLPEPHAQPLPEDAAVLVPLLRAIIADRGDAGPPLPHRFDDAGWIANRYCEVLPIPNQARQLLLEFGDPLSALSVIRQFLAQKKLLPD